MIHLLYGDDDQDICTIIATFCERIGAFSVKSLNSGEAALDWLRTASPDVIVSDYSMPGGMNGMRFLEELRSRGNTTPFIFFSATEDLEVKKEAYREGAFSFICKTPSGKIPIYQLIRAVGWAVARTSPEPGKRQNPGKKVVHETPDP
ncbi:response regulator receiver protein [Methanoregula boonei 6A8]|jgi:two-component system response regulator|uniref:Response regulator receiver protein n=1 Tax=Methanoregula boonei (strain DSM 21154 / JCM 14090 / 6A8) TaxID=456442 RepID=A7I542_METB6|nr:response regulator [Methanoregula boonei]ABS54853.1 response regulator receiver protein [Methanoregula boonei 6A8]